MALASSLREDMFYSKSDEKSSQVWHFLRLGMNPAIPNSK
ncbi:Uncharacterised protein [Serratia rubidaea]|nr:Uncharacterised protein [Serratia rubidaea]